MPLGLGVLEISIAAGTGADVMMGAASAPTADVLARGAEHWEQHFTWAMGMTPVCRKVGLGVRKSVLLQALGQT